MTTGAFHDISKLEADLWAAADNLRANSKLTSSDYFMPVLGVIFLRHAANRFDAATAQIAADQAAGKMPKRPLTPADYVRRRALWLPEQARFDRIMEKASVGDATDLPKRVTEAMEAIEAEFEPLKGVLPKDYGIFESDVLEDLLRLFNSEQIRKATGDVFGRIYEYFLAKFSIQKAHDNGEFFTPSSIVQTIVNIIEPDHGTVFDPACGSGGMFVQSSHFIEHEGKDTAKAVVFFGQEKNRDTIRIAKMNLAVHGLDGKIAEAITYYQDEHSLLGKCDFVMANPPFNVDLVDAKKVEGDKRLPFGLPGVNKSNKVGNGNYLWISYFWSYLGPKGRAGFVMSSQASSAGHGEKDVRRKIVETGDVDVMVAIRSNFFYTRTVPCELWHFDRNKPAERKDKVLMLDARGIYRKVTRKIFDFSPEQMKNLSAVVWLYRGQNERFLNLVRSYIGELCREAERVGGALATFDSELAAFHTSLATLAEQAASLDGEAERARTAELKAALAGLKEARTAYDSDRKALSESSTKFVERYAQPPLGTNEAQHEARAAFEPTAEAARGLAKQVDLLHKLAGKAASVAQHDLFADLADRRGSARKLRALDEHRKKVVEQLKLCVYFHRQVVWLQDRFPAGVYQDVVGLVKAVTRAEIEAADWSLTPGRYVGVAPPEVDEDFDFEQAIRDIHVELADLNAEAAELAATIQSNLEALT